MTDEERRNLKPGDCILLQEDQGKQSMRVVCSEPWQLGHGEWVIGLCDISGGYQLSRVVRKVPFIDRDLTPREAEVSFETAPVVPLSEEEIAEIVKRATN